MSHLTQRIAALSPEKRALLEQQLLALRKNREPSIPLRPENTDTCAAAPAQERMWFNHHWDPETPVYTEAVVLRVRGPLRTDLLGRAFQEVVHRHEILRTCFVSEGGELRQKIAARMETRVACLEAAGATPEEREAEAQRLAETEARRVFAPDRLPLARLASIRTDAENQLVVLTAHHIIFDGWSAGIFFRELFALYAGFQTGPPAALPPLTVQYADYAAWQRASLGNEQMARELAFWKQVLRPPLPVLDLPTDRARPALRTSAGARLHFAVPRTIAAGIEELGRRQGATPMMVLLAAFQALLSRWTGQDDLLTGVPVTNRDRTELEPLIGNFVNTLVYRADLADDPTFVELVERTRRFSVEAHANKHLPFERLLDELPLPRDASRTPLFQAAFDYQKLPRPETPSGLRVTYQEVENGTCKFDLGLSIRDSGDGLLGQLEYNTALFDRAAMERLARHYQTLLRSVLAEPQGRVSRLPLLAPEEHHKLLREWNDTVADLPEKTLAELFEAQAVRTPDAPAVRCGEEVWTFRELDARAGAVAARLRRLGVRGEEPVGLWADRSLATMAGLWGIWKAGAAYVPLDPAYPRARLEFVAADAGIRILVAAGRHGFGDAVVCVDPADPGPADESGADPAQRATPGSLAYVLYTSGSTGEPKGVMVEHRSVVNLLGALRAKVYGDARGPLRVSVNGSLAFDTSIKQVIQLLDGHALELIPEEARIDPQQMAQYLCERRVDVLDCTPTQWMGLMDAGLLEETRGGPRIVLLGGEPVSEALWGRLSRARHMRFYNLYGPTECTVDATCARVGADCPGATIGRPLANVRVYILDRFQQPVPQGVYGELAIAGAGVARGYWKRPKLTAARFVADPFADDPGARMYRTGDFGRYLPDGSIEFRGRADGQIKWRGFRIELEEIESALRGVPGVREAAAVLADAGSGHARLAAHVAPDPARRASAGGRPRRRLPNGLAVVEINANETDFLYRDLFENRAYLRHGISIGPGDCVFDAGANIGLFTLFAHLCAPGVRIYAAEPNLAACEALRLNAELYGAQVCVLETGLSNQAGRRRYTHYPGFTSLSGVYADVEAEKQVVRSFVRRQESARGREDALERGGTAAFEELLDSRFRSEELEIEVTTLSRLIAERGIGRIDLLKINVEKSELDVLEGIDAGDWPKIRQIAMEVHDLGGRLGTVRALLAERGYQVAVEQDWQLEAGTCTNYYVYAAREGARRTSPAGSYAQPAQLPEPFLTAEEVRRALAERLPAYMLPSSIVIREALPVTPNGKIDRAALARESCGRAEPAAGYVAPRTPAEKTLAGVWAEVLGAERIGVHDDFFELGGDSILSIQIAAKAALAGLRLTTKDIFQHKTIAGLCAEIGTAPARAEGQEEDDGPAPLAPMQRRFLEEFADASGRNHFNQWMLLEVPQDLELEAVRAALARLTERHAALRLRFERTAEGWRQAAAPRETADLLSVVDSESEEQCNAAAARLHAALDLARGPVFRAALVRAGSGRPARVLWVAHHMVVDSASWHILLEEFSLLCRGMPLPPETCGFPAWARRLQEYAAGEAVLAEMPSWLSRDWRGAAFAGRREYGAGTHEARISLDERQTELLLRSAPRACHATVEELLLAALAQTLAEWIGNPRLWIELESQGREHPLERVDISRTVGWFTAIFPLLLDLRGADSPAELLLAVKEQRRAVPQRGFGYGILRYLREDTAPQLREAPRSDLLFNYLGQMDGPAAGGLSRDARLPASHGLQVDAWVAGGRLECRLTAAAGAFSPSEGNLLADRLACSLRELLPRWVSAGAALYTPADFPAAQLSRAKLARVLADLESED
ncbi:MAG TPA: amino acid adenylation domain-containing protein [Bryobacteraceae bacterium]|nr:amino acid adenylation domain-containing protein [Bryobacteraceae bacterium]